MLHASEADYFSSASPRSSKAQPSASSRRPSVPREVALRRRGLENRRQLRRVERLDDVMVEARRLGARLVRGLPPPRHRDEHRVAAGAAQAPSELVTVDARQTDVEESDRGLELV